MPDYKKRLIDIMAMNGDTMPDECQIFIADDILYHVDKDKTISHETYLPPEHYGVVAPPFPLFWVEARTNPELLKNSPLNDLMVAAAVSVIALDDAAKTNLREHTNFYKIAHDRVDDAKWTYFIKSHRYEYTKTGQKNLYLSTHTAMLPIDADGMAIFDQKGVPVSAIEYNTVTLAAVHAEWARHNRSNPEYQFHPYPAPMVSELIPLVLRTVSALHRREEIIETSYPSNYKKRVKKRYGYEPRNNYYLRVGNAPRNTYAVSSGASGRKGSKNRTHYRTGHFKYYSEDKPHVSGLTGMMWVNSTIVNRNKQDTIDKRYDVKGESND